MSKHTPGPWTIEESELMGRDIVSAGNMALICTQVYSPDDARLIAAAPELLAALQAVAEQTRHPDYDWPVCLSREVSAAIAKATGSES